MEITEILPFCHILSPSDLSKLKHENKLCIFASLDWQAYIISYCISEAQLYIDFINGGILFDWQWLIEMI